MTLGLNVSEPEKRCSDSNCPFHGTLDVRGQTLYGQVASTDMDKTVIVEREYDVRVPKYDRLMKRRSRIPAHLPPCLDVEVGDEVRVAETRPLSKTKSHVVVEIAAQEDSGTTSDAPSEFTSVRDAVDPDLDASILTETARKRLNDGGIEMVAIQMQPPLRDISTVNIEVYDDDRMSVYWNDSMSLKKFLDRAATIDVGGEPAFADLVILDDDEQPGRVDPTGVTMSDLIDNENDHLFVSLETDEYVVSWEQLSQEYDDVEIVVFQESRDPDIARVCDTYLPQPTESHRTEPDELIDWIDGLSAVSFDLLRSVVATPTKRGTSTPPSM